MNRLSLLHICTAVLLLISVKANAVSAYPFPVVIQQPDGTSLTVLLKGNEFHHYYTTEDGYLIAQDARGVFRYAQADAQGTISATPIKATDPPVRTAAEQAFLKNVPSHPTFEPVVRQMRSRRAAIAPRSNVAAATTATKQFPRTGSPKTLVILVNFSDRSFVVPDAKTAFTNMLNEEGYSANGATGSARDYFRDNSMGAFTPQFDVVGPFTLPQKMEYYGKNDADGQDENAVQMIVDACKVADENGVDFSQYDVDFDNIVDNVAVIFAGHNEAELAPANTVWPHRWAIYPTSMYNGGNYTGSLQSVTFDGRRVHDYFSTSELLGNSGANMTAIGTCVHEFSHTLGLPDMYSTDKSTTHHTLSRWSVMDAGNYLNNSRTPPAYNAYERFLLGYLTPTLLNAPTEITFNPLNISNQAYLISPTESHNLTPDNPQPAEFFLLENRQKTGWDAFLPGHGMLIYRINYHAGNWRDGLVNNDPAAMGVDLIEADGVADKLTMAGDPFPGTGNIRHYTPVLRNSKVLTDKPITGITETNQQITFRFKNATNAPILTASNAFTLFWTTENTPSAEQKITISGNKLKKDAVVSFAQNSAFEMRKKTDAETEWRKTITLAPVDSVVVDGDIVVRFAPVGGATAAASNTLLIQSDGATPVQVPLSGKVILIPKATEATRITDHSFVANWDAVENASGYYFTVLQKDVDGNELPLITDKWLTATTDTVKNLMPNREYTYKVKAVRRSTEQADASITEFSNTITVYTGSSSGVLQVITDGNGGINVLVAPSEVGKGIVNVFNTLGQKIATVPANARVVKLTDLPKHRVLILQSGKQTGKIILR